MPRLLSFAMIVLSVAVCTGATLVKEWKSGINWKEPDVIAPGGPEQPPEDAIVLFDGNDLSAFRSTEGWSVKDGAIIAGGKQGLTTKEVFGDCQVHLEWAAPAEVTSQGQGRGNSGVYLMEKYEVQILDSYQNETYFDGQAGAIYKQYPPLVNACRPPGEWQTYDIIFTAPRFNEDRTVKSPAYLTVLHNGVLIQNHVPLQGATAWHVPPKYNKHPEALPIHFQNHGNPVRFRNIWVRNVAQRPEKVDLSDSPERKASDDASEKSTDRKPSDKKQGKQKQDQDQQKDATRQSDQPTPGEEE
ncbi:3-keto-disaccharide hydrolase [Rubinisphaera margarita]|uniref:3-keto-disaccharide hydrolase n=1 Tax=Rubinisphaera margarita TaxID=2909586 RepID=UPI001EE7DC22|nr:DUF1080 domain-containing protein [Rubinisphaera margarita]MCG6157355.1 DUF1080 domain-containing protein [Rubinisphaera margarita]